MRLNLARSTLVFAGAWNVAIFVADGWLAERVGTPANDDPDLAILNGRPMFRYTFEDVTVTVSDGQLVITPEGVGPGTQERCSAIASRILSDLPATPVTAFGINVAFDVADVEVAALRQLFAFEDGDRLAAQGLVLETTKVTRRFRNDPRFVVNLTALHSTELAVAQLDFNHHFELQPKNALAARDALTNQVQHAVALSRTIALQTYNLAEN